MDSITLDKIKNNSYMVGGKFSTGENFQANRLKIEGKFTAGDDCTIGILNSKGDISLGNRCKIKGLANVRSYRGLKTGDDCTINTDTATVVGVELGNHCWLGDSGYLGGIGPLKIGNWLTMGFAGSIEGKHASIM